MIDPNYRLRNLRQLNAMTQKEFAAELGISQNQLSQIESGARTLTASHMVTAMQRFNIELEFFSAAPITYGPFDLNYRTRKLTQPQQRRAAVTFGLTEQAVRTVAATTNTTEGVDPPAGEPGEPRPRAVIERLATDARALIGIRHDKVINNVTRCVERLGILVTGLNLPGLGNQIDGISTPTRTDEPFVVTVDLSKPGDRLRFSVAHELGHVLLHTGDNRPQNREIREAEADSFASAFLMPRESILEELSPGLTLAGYARIKARWGVSIQAIIRRSHDLKVIDKDRYRSLHVQLSSRGWRTAEPVEVPAEIPAIATPEIGGRRPETPKLAVIEGDNVVGLFNRR